MVIRRTRRLLRRVWRRLLRAALLAALAAIALVLLFRWVNPPPGLFMVAERMRLGGIQRDWVALPAMSDNLPLSAAAAEDANFCRHSGFDLAGIRAALADDGRVRGASTISQQVAKNVFLWPGRTWPRKGLEAGFTLLIELAVAEAADHGGLPQRRRDGRGRVRRRRRRRGATGTSTPPISGRSARRG